MMQTANQSGEDLRTRSLKAAGRWPPAELLMLLPALLTVALLFGGGLLLGLLQSLGSVGLFSLEHLTTAHFGRMLSDPDFLPSLGLTFAVAAVSTAIALALSLALALFLVFFQHRNTLVRFIVQIPLTVPHLVVAVAMVFLLSPTGVVSRVAAGLGLIEASRQFPLLVNDPMAVGIVAAYVWKEVPFITLMLMAVLANTGTELMQVGQTLNAGRWQRFRYILLPTVTPALGAAGLIVFAFTFGAFEIPYLLGQTYPMMLPVWAYKNYSDVDLLARPEGIATGLLIAGVVALSVVVSQWLAQTARKRGVIL
jgi:putative spermidine/putrescine transport system permease protein